jgi:hypothetical protein
MPQVWPPALNAAFWQQHTRAQLQQVDLIQSLPSLLFDLYLYGSIRIGWARAGILALLYVLKAVQMWLVLGALRRPGQHSSAYSPARRNTLVLGERLVRVWLLTYVASVFDEHEGKPAALGGPASGTWRQELFWACRTLLLGSGAIAAFWQSRFMSLPWWQEALLLGNMLRLSLHWRLEATAAIFSSWRPGGSTHYLHLGKLVVRAIGSASCRLVSAAGQQPPRPSCLRTAALPCSCPCCLLDVSGAAVGALRTPAGRSATQPTSSANQPTSQPANQPTSQPAGQPTSHPARRPSHLAAGHLGPLRRPGQLQPAAVLRHRAGRRPAHLPGAAAAAVQQVGGCCQLLPLKSSVLSGSSSSSCGASTWALPDLHAARPAPTSATSIPTRCCQVFGRVPRQGRLHLAPPHNPAAGAVPLPAAGGCGATGAARGARRCSVLSAGRGQRAGRAGSVCIPPALTRSVAVCQADTLRLGLTLLCTSLPTTLHSPSAKLRRR